MVKVTLRSRVVYILLLMTMVITYAVLNHTEYSFNPTSGVAIPPEQSIIKNESNHSTERTLLPLTIATYARNEGSYLAEWVEFHYLNGVTDIIIYDHGSTDITEKVIRALDRHNKVKLTHIKANEVFLECMEASTSNGCRIMAERDAITRTQGKSRWLGFLDINEFLWPVQSGTSISDILQAKYNSADVLDLTATIWGSNDIPKKVQADPTNHYYPLVLGTYFKRADPATHLIGDVPFYSHAILVNPLTVRNDYYQSRKCKIDCVKREIKVLADDLRINNYKYKSRAEAASRNPPLVLDDITEISMNLIQDESIFYQLPNLIYRLESIQLLEPLYGNVEELFDRELLHKMHDNKAMDTNFEKPQICAAFLSCKRYPLLKRAMSAFIRYMHDFEPGVTYEIAVWDNGGGPDITENILKDFPIDSIVLSSRNVGLAKSLNGLFFGLCKAPYILSLEEDWEARIESWPKSMPIIQMAMDVLELDEKVLEVWVRDFGWEWDIHQKRDPWTLTPRNELFKEFFENGQAQYRRQFAGDLGWGAYSNGASLKHKARLESIGNFESANGEGIMARKVRDAGYASAHICNIQSEDILLNNRCNSTQGSGQMLFRHIGHVKSSPGHNDYNGRT